MQFSTIPKNLILLNSLPPNDTHPKEDWQSLGPTNIELNSLKVPNLRKLLKTSQIKWSEKLTPDAYNTPFENIFARLMEWPIEEGRLPFAQMRALERALINKTANSDGEWALITLCNWNVHQGQVSFTADAQSLGITHAESAQILNDMQPYFKEDSIELFFDSNLKEGQWLAFSPHFKSLSCASVDKVKGLSIDDYLIGKGPSNSHPSSNKLRRLQNEMQMLLYNHPINDARSVHINSFWISGCGEIPKDQLHNATHIYELSKNILVQDILSFETEQGKTLTSASELKEFWTQSWEHLDSHLLIDYLDSFKLADNNTSISLCNDSKSITLVGAKQGWGHQIRQAFSSTKLSSLLHV